MRETNFSDVCIKLFFQYFIFTWDGPYFLQWFDFHGSCPFERDLPPFASNICFERNVSSFYTILLYRQYEAVEFSTKPSSASNQVNICFQDLNPLPQDTGVTLYSISYVQKVSINPREKGASLSLNFDSIQKHISDAVEDTRKECGWKADFVLPYVEDVSELLYFETKLLENVGTCLVGNRQVRKLFLRSSYTSFLLDKKDGRVLRQRSLSMEEPSPDLLPENNPAREGGQSSRISRQNSIGD